MISQGVVQPLPSLFSNMEPAHLRKELVRHALEEAELETPDVSSLMQSFDRIAQREFSVKLVRAR